VYRLHILEYELDPEKIMYYSNVFVLLMIELASEHDL